MRVQELLKGTGPVVSLPPGASALEAARKMAEHEQGSVLVAENDRLLGIFTERDLMLRVVAAGKQPAATRLEEVMSTEVYVTTPDRLVRDVRRELRDRHIRHVPVVGPDGRVQTVLSMRDLLWADLSETRNAARDMEGYIRGDVG